MQKIRQFRNRPEPKVVVTVDMLSTGVDIPALEFIVFLRMVKSRILWVQMLGRGTRLCKEINKEKFTVFDCFDGTLIEYFKDATDIDAALDTETTPLPELVERIFRNEDREHNVQRLIKRLRRVECTMSGEAIEKFAAFIPEGNLSRFLDQLPTALKNDAPATFKVLRNPSFQKLLLDYLSPPQTSFLRRPGNRRLGGIGTPCSATGRPRKSPRTTWNCSRNSSATIPTGSRPSKSSSTALRSGRLSRWRSCAPSCAATISGRPTSAKPMTWCTASP